MHDFAVKRVNDLLSGKILIDGKKISHRKLGPVGSAVHDPKTGQFFGSISLKSASQIKELDPFLIEKLKIRKGLIESGRMRELTIKEYETFLKDPQSIINKYPDQLLVSPTTGVAGAHAEIDAINQALRVRRAAGLPVDDVALGEMSMFNIWIGGKQHGSSAPRCGNCWFLTLGIKILSGG